MSPLVALLSVLAVVIATTAVGVVVRMRSGRARGVAPAAAVEPDLLALPREAFGESATIVQFSTEFCARCPQTRRLARQIVGERDGVTHAEVDLTHRPDIAQRFGVLQTPTILVLDGARIPRTRIAGPPQRAVLETSLDAIEGTTAHV